jgi:HAD superfamily hydrolase (TIGR01459 family)
MTTILTSLDEIAERYDVVLCDLWGCLHNGVAAYPAAVEALRRFKARGGTVVLLTNAPRPRASVARQLARMDVPEDCWDVIVTSGDSARTAMFEGAVGTRVYFIGEQHDLTFFEPMEILPDAPTIERVPLQEAEGIVCTGPFDALADPSVNRPDFLYAKQKGLKLLCANPDLVVDRGESREWCAGALAALYTEMGGESLYFGKPHPPIYDLARRRLAAMDRSTPDERILCIGDGVHTDVRGAMGEDMDALFITGGLAAAETRTAPRADANPDADALAAYLDAAGEAPDFAIGFLR